MTTRSTKIGALNVMKNYPTLGAPINIARQQAIPSAISQDDAI